MPYNPQPNIEDEKLLNPLFWLMSYAEWDLKEIQPLIYPNAETDKDRTIRKLLEYSSQMGIAMIALASKGNYRAGLYKQDEEDNQRQWQETDSRIKKLEARRLMNIKLDEKIKAGKAKSRPPYWGDKDLIIKTFLQYRSEGIL